MAQLTQILIGLTMIMGVIIYLLGWQLLSTHRKLRDEAGNCRECGYPGRLQDGPLWVAKNKEGQLALWYNMAHHVNCPIGRLGL